MLQSEFLESSMPDFGRYHDHHWKLCHPGKSINSRHHHSRSSIEALGHRISRRKGRTLFSIQGPVQVHPSWVRPISFCCSQAKTKKQKNAQLVTATSKPCSSQLIKAPKTVSKIPATFSASKTKPGVKSNKSFKCRNRWPEARSPHCRS